MQAVTTQVVVEDTAAAGTPVMPVATAVKVTVLYQAMKENQQRRSWVA